MTALERFRSYLEAVEKRLRWKALARGGALLALLALAATVGLAYIADRFAFSDNSLFYTRLTLFLAVAQGLAFWLVVPLLRLNRREAAKAVEVGDAGFEQRALTLEQSKDDNPFSELLAEEALRKAEQAQPWHLVSGRLLGGLALGCALGIGVLVWLTVAGPGTLGYGAHLLWAGAPRPGAGPIYQIQVKPGDAKVRRGGDQVIEALLLGFDTPDVTLRARPAGSAKWETLRMEPKPSGGGYSFLFAGLAENLEYMVETTKMRSAIHRLTVIDLPAVKKLRAVYHYPSFLGIPVATVEPAGDLRAVEGTDVDLHVTTDRPLTNGVLIIDDGSRISLAAESGNTLIAKVPIRKDGMYYVAAIEDGTPVRLTEDYFIEAKAERPPEVKISKPGRDAKVSPIEEVTVELESSDDFGLNDMELRYSVNGGAEKSVPLLRQKGVKDAHGSTTISLEDFKLSPGDVVGIYAVARDAKTTTQTDIFFLEAQPFEKEYQQSQTAGGGGGGGGEDQQGEIAQRQKEIIAATWNQIKNGGSRAQAQENAQFLSGVQQKLSDQAKSLAQRMRSRELAGTNEEFQKFSKEMDLASAAMNEATGQLKGQKWKDSLSPEQKALQHLLRAESMFRQIQVAFGQRGGGGGGGGGQMRDLESLFDLELDTEKNQYETAQSRNSQEQREKEVDEALKKLEELARRQQELAQQQQQQKQQAFQQRWAQEMLRREAEELRKKMEQLQRGESQQGQQGQQSQSQQGQSQQGQPQQGGSSGQAQQGRSQGQPQRGQQGSNGQQQQNDQRMARAQQQLDRALDDMRKAQSEQGQNSTESARRAAERMKEARDMVGGMRQQQSGQRMDDLTNRSQQLAERQKQYENQIRQMYPDGVPAPGARPQPGQNAPTPQTIERLAQEKEAMEREYKRLEQQMKDTARAMDGSQKGAASRLREALGEAQQSELGLRLKFGSEWVRRGLGPYLPPREKVVTDSLDKLSRQVQEARDMAQRGQQAGEGRERTEQALNQLEQLRGRMQGQLQRGQQGQGQQQGQQGQQGQGQGQQGQQKGQGQGQGQQGGGQRGGEGQAGGGYGGRQMGRGSFGGIDRGRQPMGVQDEYGAINDGRRQFDPGPRSSQQGLEGTYDEALRQLRQLRQDEGADDETKADVDRLIRDMQRLDPRKLGDNPTLMGRIESDIVPQMEQLELRLRKQLENGPSGGQVRSGSQAKAPAGYGDAVAEYFRKLSRGK